MVSTSNREWKSGMNESELIYKSFYKTLDRAPLNDIVKTKKGLHLYRKLQAEIKHFQRIQNVTLSSSSWWSEKASKEQEEYFKSGIVIYNNFIGSSVDVDNIKKEFDSYPMGVSKNNRNIISQNRDKGRRLYNVSDLIFPIIWNLVGGTEKEVETKFRNNTFAQRVQNTPLEKDHQKLIHLDTYFPAIKFWWFPEAVTKSNGPLCYVKNSCYADEKLQMWYYKQSVDVCEKSYESWRGKDHTEGSFRVSEEELAELGLELQPVEVQADTLVIANVAGFHSRGDATEEHIRNSVHGSIRLDLPLE